MSLLSGLTVKPLLYACSVLLVALLLVSGSFWVDHSTKVAALKAADSELDARTTERDAWKAKAADSARAANVNAANVDDLAAKLAAAVGAKQDTERALADAIAARNSAQAARDTALDTLKKTREITYATDPQCKAWAAAAVCGGLSGSLQQQWDQARSAGYRGGDQGGGGGQAAAGADR